MPTAVLSFPPLPEVARTARLVVGAAARRAGLESGDVDDVKLAVSEAVARAMLRSAPTSRVLVSITDDPDRFRVDIGDGASPDFGREDEDVALSLIRAVAPRTVLTENERMGQTVTLAWPLTRN